MSTNIVFEVQDTNQDAEILEAKRQQMQAKLNARLDARKQQSEALKSSEAESNAAGDKVTQFLRGFESSRAEVETKLNSWKNIDTTELPKYFDAISTSVAEIRDSLAQASIYLSTFDVQTCQTAIDKMLVSVEATRNEAIPKKKFSFAAAKRKVAPAASSTTADQTPSPTLSSLVPKVKEVRNRTNETIMIPSEGENDNGADIGDLSFDSLSDCTIIITKITTAIRINNMTRCKFLVAPTNGSIFIESCKECQFVTASRQIRIHETQQSDFYIFTLSRPTIENCHGVRFSPYNLKVPRLDSLLEDCGFKTELNQWKDVQDFNWLKPDSPNWTTIPDSDVQEHLVSL